METDVIGIIILVIAVCYGIAYFFGSSRHIGVGWSLALLVLGGVISGIVAIAFSPSAKGEPTKANSAHKTVGWIFLVLAVLNLFGSLASGHPNPSFTIPLIIGIYLIQLGDGQIVNKRPKYFFDMPKRTFAKPQNVTTHTSSTNNFSGNQPNYSQEVSSNYRYYIVENGNQSEPLTIQELKDKNIDEDTLVWRKGLDNWVKSKDLEELNIVVNFTPPPIPEDLKIEHFYEVEGKKYTAEALEKELIAGNYVVNKDTPLVISSSNQTKVALRHHSNLKHLLKYFPPDLKV